MNSLEKSLDKNELVVAKIDECVEKSKVKVYDFVKRFIDIIISTIGLVICLPLFIIIAIIC